MTHREVYDIPTDGLLCALEDLTETFIKPIFREDFSLTGLASNRQSQKKLLTPAARKGISSPAISGCETIVDSLLQSLEVLKDTQTLDTKNRFDLKNYLEENLGYESAKRIIRPYTGGVWSFRWHLYLYFNTSSTRSAYPQRNNGQVLEASMMDNADDSVKETPDFAALYQKLFGDIFKRYT